MRSSEPPSLRDFWHDSCGSASRAGFTPEASGGSSSRTFGKEMKTAPERIVADGQRRIHNSESFAARKKLIAQEMILTLSVEIESAGWI